MDRITDEAIAFGVYIGKTWPGFVVKMEQSLAKILPEPSNRGLKHIWRYGSADVAVYRGDKLICIFEPGGSHHFQDEKQMKNDRRKWKLCEINGVRCLRIANGVIGKLSNRQKRKMFGRFLFGVKNV